MYRIKDCDIQYITGEAVVGADPEQGTMIVVHSWSPAESWFETGMSKGEVLDSVRSDYEAGEIKEWVYGRELIVQSCDNCGEDAAVLHKHWAGEKLCDQCLAENDIVKCGYCDLYSDEAELFQMGSKRVCPDCQDQYHGRSEYPWDGGK